MTGLSLQQAELYALTFTSKHPHPIQPGLFLPSQDKVSSDDFRPRSTTAHGLGIYGRPTIRNMVNIIGRDLRTCRLVETQHLKYLKSKNELNLKNLHVRCSAKNIEIYITVLLSSGRHLYQDDDVARCRCENS